MAKKVVATLKKEGGQVFVKCIKMVKNPETGAYQFKSAIMVFLSPCKRLMRMASRMTGERLGLRIFIFQ